MKTPYLDDLVRFHGCDYSNHELEQVKQALEPKVSKEEYYHLIGRCDSGLISEDELAEKLFIKFKEPEVELVEGEWYFVKFQEGKNCNWQYLKYKDTSYWKGAEIREKNNPPT